MLIKLKRINVDTDYTTLINLILNSNKYFLKGIIPEIADIAVNLPASINKDPADRLISATTLINRAKLVTADENIKKSGIIQVIW